MAVEHEDHTLGALARNFLIRAWPLQHNRLSKRMYKKPEYCAACHKQFIDQEVNRVGWVQLQNQYDNWAASHWNHKGDARSTVECRECHMPLVDSTDPAAGTRRGRCLFAVEIPALRIPQCQKCGEQLFTISVDQQIQAAFLSQQAIRAKWNQAIDHLMAM